MGKFELAVMSAIMRLRSDAYGRRLEDELERDLGKAPAPGQIYVVLNRLQQRGLISSSMGEATPIRGGKAKKIYELSGAGVRALHDEVQGLMGLLRLTPDMKGCEP